VGAFTDSVDSAALTVLDPPDYIFLCGGPLADLEHSLRAQFYERKAKSDPDLLKRIQLAEDADRWYRSHKVFDDLLELEELLAGLSACILLFVESPGAIAEFGAFSQMALLREKLIVVVERSHYDRPSFIRNGPIEQMLRVRPDDLLSYRWLSAPVGADAGIIDVATLNDTLDDIVRAVQTTLSGKPRTSGFMRENQGHLMLLIADLVKLNVVSLQGEILEILNGLKVPVEKSLAKYLFLLGQLGFISEERYGRNVYYVSPAGAPDHIRYAPRTPLLATDRSRLRSLLRLDFPPNEQKTRALDAFNRRIAGATP
jgi:hypothetical protein